jgi:hypothetical protein
MAASCGDAFLRCESGNAYQVTCDLALISSRRGVSPVKGYANLFAGASGTRLDVAVPASQADAAAGRCERRLLHPPRRPDDRDRRRCSEQ